MRKIFIVFFITFLAGCATPKGVFKANSYTHPSVSAETKYATITTELAGKSIYEIASLTKVDDEDFFIFREMFIKKAIVNPGIHEIGLSYSTADNKHAFACLELNALSGESYTVKTSISEYLVTFNVENSDGKNVRVKKCNL